MRYESIMFTTIGLGFLVGVAIGASACVTSYEPNLNHCAQQEGDAACMEKYKGARPYCAMCGDGANDNDGCVAAEPTDVDCYSPCGHMQSKEEESSCIAVAEGDGDGEGEGEGEGEGGDGDGEPMPCSGPLDCTHDPATPFCDDGKCVGCKDGPGGDVACAGLGEGDTPVCVGGLCVECVAGNEAACMGVTPVCNDAHTCVGCTEHDECPETACNMEGGNCIAHIMHVDDSNNDCDDMGVGSEDEPYCSLEAALSKTSGEALIFIHAMEDGSAYEEENTVDDTIVLFGVPNEAGDRPILEGANSPALVVEGSGSLWLRGVEISGSKVEGLRVAGKAWLEQSLVFDNDEGGIVVVSGALIAENSFVAGSTAASPALSVANGMFELRYVSLGLPAAVDGPVLQCTDGAASTVRNSLLTSTRDVPEIDCPNLTVETSALEMSLEGNTKLDDVDVNWFVDYIKGDFHLADPHPKAIDTAAIWRTGDPTTDIDGDLRPVKDGSPDFAGADAL